MKPKGYIITILIFPVLLLLTILGGLDENKVLADETGYVNISDEKVEIGNKYIEQTFDISKGKLQTTKILNKRIDMEIVPQKGSEDFLIQLVSEEGENTNDRKINASDLTVKETKEVDYKTGKMVQFIFEDYMKNNASWSIAYNVFVEDDGAYLRGNLEISTPDKDKAIDYIDANKIELPDDVEGLFHHPPLEEISSMWMGEHEMTLGQPIYANGMFFGSEFPASDTDVVDESMQVRYYSGKDFKKLKEDNQLNDDGSYTTWNSVMGAATGTDKDVVQTALFSYIDDIATKTEFQKQYNSWYDNMMDITDESIKESFYGTEKELSKNGVEPLDAYVVDDGWNAYDNGSGSPYENKTGFWEFNDKFPNELYPASDMAEKFGSTFGLWNGPQGGYNYFGDFAEFLEQNGTGHVTNEYWKAIDVGSRTYLNNLTNLFVDYQNRFDIDYWKLDGFALRPATEEGNDHMVGGDNDMYFTSDLWEAWIQSFEAMREERSEKERDLFLNLTSYVNPSPWLLQWGNTVWLQDSADFGFLDTYGGSQADQAISYRDNVYFNIFKKNDLQFPLKNVYNHDPVYGVSANVEFSDEDFRNYMMINATRGTAFWELYFSPSIMNDEKWRITADVLDWAENNSETLEKAKLFGERPDEGGVYGYSSWNESEGIVSFRNAGDKEQTYELTLDDVVGVPTDLEHAKMVQILPRLDETNKETINYGDKLEVTLEPHESIIYQFTMEDKKPPKVQSIKNTDENMVQVKFDQRIQNPTFTVNGQSVEGDILDDYRTVDITTANLVENENTIDINVENIWGDDVSETEEFLRYEDGTAAALYSKDDLVNGEDLEKVRFEEPNIDLYHLNNAEYDFANQTPLSGTNDFSVSLKMRMSENNQTILSQEDTYHLKVDDQGYLNFTVGEEILNSKETITTVDEKAHGTFGTEDYKPTTTQEAVKGKVDDGNLHDIKAVREANGMLKLYVDGELVASKYVKEKYPLTKGNITLGSPEAKFQVAEVEVRNHSIAYDEAEKSYEDLNLEEGYKAMDQTEFKAYANSEEKEAGSHEGPVENVLDGKSSTWWHTQYNGEQPTVPHWVTIEMPEAEYVDAYKYVSRNGNGNVKKYELQISDTNEKGSWKTIESGEMEDGGSTLIEFDEPVKSKFYRLYITETYGNPPNTFASAAEIKLYTKNKGTADFSELAPAYNDISHVDETKYTEESLENSGFNALKDLLETTYLNPNSSQNNVDEAVADFNQNYEMILEQLVEKSDDDDTTPPEIFAKMNGKELPNQVNITDSEIVTFTWEVTDDESGVDYVVAKFDDEVYEKDTDVDLAGKLGEHTLIITAEDKAGNIQQETYSIFVTTSASDMMALVERFEKEGAFENEVVVHQLNLHLTSLKHFEEKGSDEKVVKHAKGLQTLLNYQEEKDLISEKAYEILTDDAEYLVEKYK